MGLIYVPERRIRSDFKPDFPVALNADLVGNPMGFWIFQHSGQNLADDRHHLVPAGSVSIEAGVGGKQTRVSGTASAWQNQYVTEGRWPGEYAKTVLLSWNQDVTITSAGTTDYGALCGIGSSKIAVGATTASLTGETLTILEGTNRTGITATLQAGVHTVVFVWDTVDRYDVFLDGVKIPTIHTSTPAGTLTPNIAGTVGFAAGNMAGTSPNAPLLNSALLCAGMWGHSIAESAAVELSASPWRILRPLRRKGVFIPSASALPTLAAITASLLTSSGARLTVT